MSDTLILYEKNNAVVSAGFTDKKLTSFSVEENDNPYQIGNIYVGKVSKVILHMKAAYVDIGMPSPCYMELVEGFPYVTDIIHPDGQLHVGDNILVQIKKEAIRKKPVTVTPEVSVTGRYFYVKYSANKGISFSSKIKDGAFKKKKKADFMYLCPEHFNILFRTNAFNASDEELLKELEYDLELLSNIIEQSTKRVPKTLIHKTVPEYISILRDSDKLECDKIITDSPQIFIDLKEYLNSRQPELLNNLSFYSDKVLSLDCLYDMRKHISEVVAERVWLKSGAHIVIEQTEALTSIDVNSSKASADKSNFKEGFLKINIEAAEEIFRQLELRDISGIIIVDFINMKGTDPVTLFKKINEISSRYKGVTVVDMTALGLVEITRNRIRRPVKELVQKYNLLDK